MVTPNRLLDAIAKNFDPNQHKAVSEDKRKCAKASKSKDDTESEKSASGKSVSKRKKKSGG